MMSSTVLGPVVAFACRLRRRMPAVSCSAALLGSFLLVLATNAAPAQDWEWDRNWGYHQEEWYDPSDWFDEDTGIDYEYDDPYARGYDQDYRYTYDVGNDIYGSPYDGGYYGDNFYSYDWYDEDPGFDAWYD